MKYIYKILFISCLVCNPFSVHAAEVFFQAPAQVLHIGQEMYIDVFIDPKGEAMNAIDITIQLPNGVSLVRTETVESIINTWIQRPLLKDGGMVTLSGVIVHGFDGFIDPFDRTIKKPGRIIRLIVRGEFQDSGMIEIPYVTVHRNDGNGSIINTHAVSYPLVIDAIVSPRPIDSHDTVPPVIHTASIVYIDTLFSGRPTLVVDASDVYGIDYMAVKEGILPWRVIQSPAPLRIYTGSFFVKIKAVDFSNNSTIITIPTTGPMRIWAICIVGVLIFFAIIFFCAIIRKYHFR